MRLAHTLVALMFVGQTTTIFAQNRWVELDYNNFTLTYDLTTVQLVDPGRFTIMYTDQDHPDIVQLKLVVLKTLRTYCGRPDGEYDPPPELFTLGPPDLPIEKIEVKTRPGSRPFKSAGWHLPYHRLVLNFAKGPQEDTSFFACEGPLVGPLDKEYEDLSADIMNGITSKVLYDCRHGIIGAFINADDPPSKAITGTNITGANLDAYVRLCAAIVGGVTYMPSNPPDR